MPPCCVAVCRVVSPDIRVGPDRITDPGYLVPRCVRQDTYSDLCFGRSRCYSTLPCLKRNPAGWKVCYVGNSPTVVVVVVIYQHRGGKYIGAPKLNIKAGTIDIRQDGSDFARAAF